MRKQQTQQPSAMKDSWGSSLTFGKSSSYRTFGDDVLKVTGQDIMKEKYIHMSGVTQSA